MSASTYSDFPATSFKICRLHVMIQFTARTNGTIAFNTVVFEIKNGTIAFNSF